MRKQMSRLAGEAALARSQNKVFRKAEAKGLTRGTIEWNRFVYGTDYNPFQRAAALGQELSS
jgi:hypothetical protein